MIEQGQGFFGLEPGSCRLGQWQRFVGVDVEFDFSHLHIKRQVDQHRARAAGAHFVKGFLEGIRHLTWFHHSGRPLGDGFDDGGDIDSLEVFFMHPRPWRLAGDAQNRDRVGRGTV